MTDPLGNTTRFAYDGLNRLVTSTDAAGGSATTTYDDVGNVVASEDQLTA